MLAAWLIAAPAFAQDISETPADDRNETAQTGAAVGSRASGDIIVTAQRRPTRIQDVPFAVTAVGQEEVLERGAAELRDLQFSIPGLNIVSLNPGADRILLRGIDPGSGTGLPIVGIYVDEVGISVDQQQRDPPFPLVDIARVEVLRGPQGTSFGQGSVAGTIRYITEEPNLERVTGTLFGNAYSQEGGDIGYRLNGAVGIPLVNSELGVRLVGGYERFAGWIDYPGLGIDNANVTERKFLRGRLLWQPNAIGRVSLLYQYLDQTSDTSNLSDLDDPRRNSIAPALGPSGDRSHLVNLSVELNLGGVTLTSATGYQHRDNLIVGVIPGAPIVVNFDTTYEQVTQEVRLSSADTSGPLQWVVGGWYRYFDSQVDRTATLAGAPFPGLSLRGDDPVDSEARAVFGDITWRLSERIDLSGGLRYYWDDRTNTGLTPAGPLPVRRASFDSFSPRANLLFRWNDDVSTYATIAKGFRSGGFNSSGTSYGPETLWSYEVGTKAALFGRALNLDVAGYYLDYKNRQSQGVVLINGANFTETTNGGAASGFGIEAAASAKLPAGLGLDFTIAYNNVRYDTTTQDTNAGEPFDYVPALTASASLHQRIPLADRATGYWRVDYQYGDPTYSIQRANNCNPATGACTPGATLEDYRLAAQNILNARIGVEFGNWDLSADIFNILNEDAETFLFSPAAAFQQGVLVRPRSYGLTLRYRFG